MPDIIKGSITGGPALDCVQAAFAAYNPGFALSAQTLEGEWFLSTSGVTYAWLERGSAAIWLERGYRTQEGDNAPLPAAYAPDPLAPHVREALTTLSRQRDAVAPTARAAVDGLLGRFDGRVYAGDPMGDFWRLREACGSSEHWATGPAGDALRCVLAQAGRLGWSTRQQSGWEPIACGDQLVATRDRPLRGRGDVRLWCIEDGEAGTTHCSATRRLPYLRDTAGGCAPGFDAFRRLPLTWFTEAGAPTGDGRNRLNSHVVNIAAEQSRTHYHPAQAVGGGKPQCELYFVLDPGALGLHTAGRRAMLHSFPDIDHWERFEATPLRPGDVVVIPPDTGHRGLDVLANVVTLPGFKPGNECYIDAIIARSAAGKAPFNPAFANVPPAAPCEPPAVAEGVDMMVVSASHASPLRAVHVGVAGRGEWPLRLMAADERWRSVGLVDVSTDNLARARTMTGLATDACFPDLAEALRAVPADAVVVVTPSALHGRFIRLALEAGKHVLVEKPFVHHLAEAEELVALAEAQHRQIVVAQQYRFNVQQRALHAALASGEFGTPGYATMVHHRHRPDPRAFTMPHAMLVEMSVHHFDDMRAVFGREAEAISARSFDPPWSRYQGGAVMAAITFAGGLEVAYAGTFTSVDDLFEWRIECERGALCWDASGLYARLPGDGRQELPAEQGPRPEQVVLDHFTAALLSGAPTPISGKANLGTLAMLDAAIHSSQDGQRAAIAHSQPQS